MTISPFALIADYSRQNEECCAAVYLPTHNYVAGVGQTTSIDRHDRARARGGHQ